MQEQQLFEYAVIRVMPRVEREEFLNVGVILYCAKKKFLKVCYDLNENRLSALCEKVDLQELEVHLAAFKRIAEGDSSAGAISRLDQASRFRWLTALRSTIIQTSRIHPGFCKDPEEKLTILYNQLVL